MTGPDSVLAGLAGSLLVLVRSAGIPGCEDPPTHHSDHRSCTIRATRLRPAFLLPTPEMGRDGP